MSAQFDSANSQRLKLESPPITGYPFTIACWVYVKGTNFPDHLFSLTNTGSTNNIFVVETNSPNWRFGAQGGGALQVANAACFSYDKWTYLVMRAISATSRRISGLTDGVSAHANNATSLTPTGINRLVLGSYSVSGSDQYTMDGNIAEFWYTATDIQPGGAQLQEHLLRQLAYQGPFSVPHIAASLIEYRSFLRSTTSDTDKSGTVYVGSKGRQNWVNEGGVTIGPHPPLAGNYRRPLDTRSLLLV